MNKYIEIVKHYEKCLSEFGDTPKGLDWPNKLDMIKRYEVMFGLIRSFDKLDRINLLDFGCGTSGLFEYLITNDIQNINYSGLDISQNSIEICKTKFPDVDYYCLDILQYVNLNISFDYIVLNGVLTVKRDLSFEEMLEYTKSLLLKISTISKIGFAFNVMSKHVDWERSDLFHLPFDMISEFIISNISRNIVIRSDYGLYEYTVYVYL